MFSNIKSKIIASLLGFLLICNGCYANHTADGVHGMVVTEQHLATQAGLNILQHGGNAIDAAVAVGYALAVVHPCCGNIGGGGFMLIHLANGTNTVINFRETAPSAISPQLFENKQGRLIASKSRLGYLAVGIPGTVLGLNTALKMYGTLPLTTVMQPAITLANHGFILSQQDSDLLHNFLSIPDKNTLQPGQKFAQKDLAQSLTMISQQGAKSFYQGKIATAIVNASHANGGVITLQDMQNYRIELQTPLVCNYRGYQIITTPPPSSGATICEILNITAGYPLSALRYHSAASIHFIVEAMRYAYADRNTYLGDPDFVSMPLNRLLSPEYAAAIRQQISPWRAGNSMRLKSFINTGEKPQTTSYAVTDQYGNAVVVTYTLNGFFGAKVIAGNTGFFLNNELDDFTLKAGKPNQFGLVQSDANLIAPNKRPLSSIAPVIITQNGKFVLAVATPGGSTIPTQTVEAIENVIDYKMGIAAAIDAPRFHMQWLPDVIYTEPFAFSTLNLIKLGMRGYSIAAGSPYHTLLWGAMVGISYNPVTQLFTGAADDRRTDSAALGY